MLKPESRLSFRYLSTAVAWFVFSCASPSSGPTDGILFSVVDAGQGLSQFVVSGNEAVVFDLGPVEASSNWRKVYTELGRPHLAAVVISHRDLDHSGGLEWIDGTINWSGVLFTGEREDTILLRKLLVNWKQPVAISTVKQGDTIQFIKDCNLECLWPPPLNEQYNLPVCDDSTNFYSLAVQIRYNHCTVLLTGDIDSTGARRIAIRYAERLRSDIVVVPHHGSAGSACPLFYGYVRPSIAVLSYGAGNSYGHPSAAAVNLLAQSGIPSISTSSAGSICWSGNGYYWTTRF